MAGAREAGPFPPAEARGTEARDPSPGFSGQGEPRAREAAAPQLSHGGMGRGSGPTAPTPTPHGSSPGPPRPRPRSALQGESEALTLPNPSNESHTHSILCSLHLPG